MIALGSGLGPVFSNLTLSGGGSGLDPITQAWLDRLAALGYPAPSGAFISDLDDMIVGMRADGDVTNLERMCIFATEDQNHARVDIISPTSPLITENGGIVWTANQGYTGNGLDAYIDTNFVLSSGVKYVQNSATIGTYNRTAAQSLGASLGVTAIVAQHFTAIYNRFIDDMFYGAVNDNGGTYNSFATTDGRGMNAMLRSNMNSTVPYKNGVAQSAAVIISESRPALNLFVFNVNVDGIPDPTSYYDGQISMYFLGNRFVNQTTFYARFQTFATARGFNV